MLIKLQPRSGHTILSTFNIDVMAKMSTLGWIFFILAILTLLVFVKLENNTIRYSSQIPYSNTVSYSEIASSTVVVLYLETMMFSDLDLL